MHKLKLPQLNRILECEAGSNLYDVLAAAELLDAPCGGKGTCGKCYVKINDNIVLSCEIQVHNDLTVFLPEESKVSKIISTGYMKKFTPDLTEPGSYGIAVDIGTTTVVATLFDLFTGEELESLSCLNSQKACGQDVITRINYAMENGDGTLRLQKKILSDLQTLLKRLLNYHDLETEQIQRITIAGNTTMIHLLAGTSPESLGSAPYKPAFTGPLQFLAGDLGLPAHGDCPVYCLPAISSFVGGDITAGIVACGIDQSKEKVLLLDIGTNGEIVLSNKGQMVSCSCAAGPALEGMNISCGMRAAEGAIEDVTIEGERVIYQSIGDSPAKGLCGSGLLAAIAQIREKGLINSGGRFVAHPLVSKVEGKKCFMVDASRNIYLSQKDIRQVQLAKGAILSGILTLLKAASLELEDLDKVIVAGQFGAHLKADSLTGSGLLPREWLKKITYAGNTSKSGAAICLLSAEERNKCESLVESIKYIELSTLDGYEQLFVDCLTF